MNEFSTMPITEALYGKKGRPSSGGNGRAPARRGTRVWDSLEGGVQAQLVRRYPRLHKGLAR